MNFTVSFRPDLNYYKEAYSEIVRNNGVKRFEPVFAIAMILSGIGLFYFDKTNVLGFFPILFSGIGAFELIKVYTSRNKWINDRVKSGVTGQEVKLQFTEDLIIHSGPFSNGNLKWTSIKSVGQTDKGVIIIPETGIVIYLPKRIFDSKDQIDIIINRKI
ncbi:MAG: YcxB family protein [Cytophagia bacterium]|nr:YcxB family protein [Cytophagia bacterium]